MGIRKPDPKKHCLHCGQRLRRSMFGSRLEDIGAFNRRVYCDRACMALGMNKEEVTKGAHLARARRFRKSNCEQCGATERLHVHHVDENWRNNDPGNLKTLCPSCHLKYHWATGDHVAKRRWVLAKGLDGLLGFCGRIESGLSSDDAAEMREHISDLWTKLPTK